MSELNIGEIIVISRGSYDDYRTHLPLRVIKAFNKAAALDEFVVTAEEFQMATGRYVDFDSPEAEQFAPWLVWRGYAEPIGAEYWHITDNYRICRDE